jgi:hypothetical protein
MGIGNDGHLSGASLPVPRKERETDGADEAKADTEDGSRGNLPDDFLASDGRDSGNQPAPVGGVAERVARRVEAGAQAFDEPEDAPPANVGNGDYDPFANVGKPSKKVLHLPTLANRRKGLDLSALRWTKPKGKPPQPKGFYWQASGSKAERGKRLVFGWTLIKNGKCQSCGARYRPPVAYLKGSAWATLQGESHERQKSEVRILIAKSRDRFDDFRCTKCLPGVYEPVSSVG